MTLKPVPDTADRKKNSQERRHAAERLAEGRGHLDTKANGELDRYTKWPTNFHKGLPHDKYGIVDPASFAAFVEALTRSNVPDGQSARFDVPLGPKNAPHAHRGNGPQVALDTKTFFSVLEDTANPDGTPPLVRNWESPLGGHAYDLEGPDAGSVGMAPAPRLPLPELCAEMAEIYAMALLRDQPLTELDNPKNETVKHIYDSLAAMPWFDPKASADGTGPGGSLTDQEKNRREARWKADMFSIDVMFRGSTSGAKCGPYLSQFMLIGASSLRGGLLPTPRTVPAAADDDVPENVNPTTAGARDPRNIAPLALPPGLQLSGRARVARANGVAADDQAVAGQDATSLGFVTFGAQTIQQRISCQLPGRDYMTDWPLWLDVQNGADVRTAQAFLTDGRARFLFSPRALATYVHFDELYQAYFVACLLMFGAKVPFDQGFPSGPYHATRGSFATFGGPHLLSLFTEVASRALKAVRRQKFQHHLRGRPEYLAGMLTLAASDHAETALGATSAELSDLRQMLATLAPLLERVAAHNKSQNEMRENDESIFPRRATATVELEEGGKSTGGSVPWTDFEIAADKNYLLPMAFPEGSPMHASYGAGHATVAGACVTVLKAFFEMSDFKLDTDNPQLGTPLADPNYIAANQKHLFRPQRLSQYFKGMNGRLFVPPSKADPKDHEMLVDTVPDPGVSIEGELDKLAANVAIARNMAGVHFYADYFDSLRMGERIAVGILQEQMTTYPEPVTMRLTSFDGDNLVIAGDGKGGGAVHLVVDGTLQESTDWWRRHVPAATS